MPIDNFAYDFDEKEFDKREYTQYVLNELFFLDANNESEESLKMKVNRCIRIVKKGVDLDALHSEGMNMLSLACSVGPKALGLVKLMVKLGANVDLVTEKSRAIDWAIGWSNPLAVSFLLDSGSSVEILDEDGLDVYKKAVSLGRCECLVVLLEKAKNIDKKLIDELKVICKKSDDVDNEDQVVNRLACLSIIEKYELSSIEQLKNISMKKNKILSI